MQARWSEREMASIRGKHRKESRTISGVAKVAIAGAIIGAPLAMAAVPANAATSSVNWDAVAQCESSGNWAADTGNGFYGGLQFTLSTWHSYGGSGMPNAASRDEQIAVAERVLAGQGIGAWPVCGKRGLGGSTSYSASSSHASAQSSTPKRATTPKVTTPKVTTQSAPAAPASAPNGDYTVVSGDTLSAIAGKLGVTDGWQGLWDKNKNVVSNPNLIFPGQKLVTK